MAQTSFSLRLQHSGLLALVFCFDTMAEDLITESLNWKNKSKIYLETKFYVAYDIEVFVLLCDIAFFLLKSSIYYYCYYCYYYYYHLIHLADIRRSYLNYCQVYNMLKILHNRNHLKHYFLLQIFCYHQVGFFSTKSNAWTLSSGRLPEQDKQLEKFSYISVLAKYAKLPLEQNNPLLK